jgi:creatinine amidohydrolase
MSSMPPWQHFKNVCYHIRTADALGLPRRDSAHGPLRPQLERFETLVELVQPHVGTRLYALPDFEANKPGFDLDNNSGGDHAGKVETSLLWAIEPDCVDMSRLPERGAPGRHFAMKENAHESNRRTGERMVADEVRFLGDKNRELLHEYSQTKPAHTLRTFADVENLWENIVRPQLKTFETMQQHWPDREPPSDDSVWRANWTVPDDVP